LARYYPVFLSVDGKRCVVVGGGRVALRKVNSLLEYQAHVEVISPEICPEIRQLEQDGQIRVIQRTYQRGDLRGALVVIAATDDQDVNNMVSREAQESGLLINVVDDAKKSNFIVPSCLHRGDISVAISTSGRSPALARKLRTKLEEELGEEFTFLALIVHEVREELKRQGIRASASAWQKALELDPLIELIRHGEINKATSIVLEKLQVNPAKVSTEH
jgi:siroheme synthase-like protein